MIRMNDAKDSAGVHEERGHYYSGVDDEGGQEVVMYNELERG